MSAHVFVGDCVEQMRALGDASVDAVVTDPPYGLSREPDPVEVLTHWLAGDDYDHSGGGFMGTSWDSFVPGPAVWREALRVLKPGGYLLAFGGTRTYDLLAIAVRLAGFEIRDRILDLTADGDPVLLPHPVELDWLYGSGFPKSHDVSKAIDSAAGAEREVLGIERTPWKGSGGSITGVHGETYRPTGEDGYVTRPVTLPATEDARVWHGWGTALKPAHEPILVARKPLTGTVAANVLEYGTGALNVDGCRIEGVVQAGAGSLHTFHGGADGYEAGTGREYQAEGRWPTNVVLTHADDCVLVGSELVRGDGHWPSVRPGGVQVGTVRHAGQDGLEERHAVERRDVWDCAPDCPVRGLDTQSGVLQSGVPGTMRLGANTGAAYGAESRPPGTPMTGYGDVGGASRFFYVAKASRAERNAGLGDDFEKRALRWSNGTESPGTFQADGTDREARNYHPTVKPVALMRWLVRLVTPPGGLVLDPFAGSGTTGIACLLEGFDFVGLEKYPRADHPDDPDYAGIARARLGFWAEHGEDALRIVADRDRAEARREALAVAGQEALF